MRLPWRWSCPLACALAFLPRSAAAQSDALYWTAPTISGQSSAILSASLDGTGNRQIVTGLADPRGITIDGAGGRIYWEDSGNQIWSAFSDGSSKTPIAAGAGSCLAFDAIGRKLYWTDKVAPGLAIRRCDPDGTNIEDLVTVGLITPVPIAVDGVHGKMYWSDHGTSTLSWANLDGTGRLDIVPALSGLCYGIAVDPIAGKLFWGEGTAAGIIHSADLDGSNDVPIATGIQGLTCLAADPAHQRLYWTISSTSLPCSIGSADYSGNNQLTTYPVPAGWQAWGIAVGPAAPAKQHYYRFENGSAGSTAVVPGSLLDSSSPVVPGTPQGGPTYRADVPTTAVLCSSNGLSMEFDGVDDVATFDAPFVFNSQFANGTIEFWMKAPSQLHSNIIWGRADGADVERFHLFTGTAGYIALDYREANGTLHSVLPDVVYAYPIDTWMHFAATRTVEASGSHTYRFYRDGVLVYTGTDSNPSLPATTVWTIAGRPPPANRVHALIDEIRMTDQALLPSEFLNAPPLPCTYCVAKVNSLGCVPAIGYTGLPTLSGPDNFHVIATNVISNKPGMMLWGGTSASTPFHGGTLCLASPIFRTPAQFSGGNTGPDDCSGAYSYHFTQAYMAAHFLTPGSNAYAQFWSRDPGFPNPDKIGLTDALHFVIGQ